MVEYEWCSVPVANKILSQSRMNSSKVMSIEIRECRCVITEFMNFEAWIINLFSLTEMSMEDEVADMSSERVIYLHWN
jgi:hypothetical protein